MTNTFLTKTPNHKEKMNWREQALFRFSREILIAAIFPTMFVIVIIIANRFFWWSYSWQDVHPIEQPQPFVRMVYSALVYVTLGAGLYALRLYQALHWLFVDIFNDWWTYRKIKAFVWVGMMLFMYSILIPTIVEFLNFIASIFFNGYELFLKSLPLLRVSAIITTILVVACHCVNMARKTEIKRTSLVA